MVIHNNTIIINRGIINQSQMNNTVGVSLLLVVPLVSRLCVSGGNTSKGKCPGKRGFTHMTQSHNEQSGVDSAGRGQEVEGPCQVGL